MLVEQRRERLLELVRQRRFATLPELAEQLQVSQSTVRRDLEILEELGATRRTHGGVVHCATLPVLPHFEARLPIRHSQKAAIALATASLIADGETVLLDGGTTTYEVARLLVGRPLHVLTNSLPVAELFAPHANSDLVMIGGNICPRTGVAQGPYAEKMLSSLRVGRTILSVAAINDEGFFNNNMMLVETERAMMRAAKHVIIVADSSKFGQQSLAHLCPLAEAHTLVVDDGLADDWRSKLAAAGIDLRVAQVHEEN